MIEMRMESTLFLHIGLALDIPNLYVTPAGASGLF